MASKNVWSVCTEQAGQAGKPPFRRRRRSPDQLEYRPTPLRRPQAGGHPASHDRLQDWITSFSVNDALSKDQNRAVGIVVGAIFIGIAIIVAAALG